MKTRKRIFFQTISDKVDPEKLDGNEGFRDTKSGSEEDADDFTDVGRDEVSDELKTIMLEKIRKILSFFYIFGI